MRRLVAARTGRMRGRRAGRQKQTVIFGGRRRPGTNKILIDEGKEHVESESREVLQRDYAEILCVGKERAPKAGSSDKEIGKFCARECCDLLTSDKRAYTELLEVEGVKEVQISKYVWDKKSCQQLYRIHMR